MSRARILSPLAAAVAALLLPVPAASASKVIAPPGNAGVGQYVEVVPGAGGATPVGAHSDHGPVLTPAQRHRLEAAGQAGRALASFVQHTGVARQKGSSSARADGGHGQPGGATHGSSKGASGGSLPAAVPSSAARPDGGGGLGWGLPAALGAIAFAAAGIAIARRRTA